MKKEIYVDLEDGKWFYGYKGMENKNTCLLSEMPFPEIIKKEKMVFYVNEEKKVVVLKYRGKTLIEKCHPNDSFNVEVGCGLAISKMFDNRQKRAMREFFRNKKRLLDYKAYAKWVLLDWFNYCYNTNEFLNEKLKGKIDYEIKKIKN